MIKKASVLLFTLVSHSASADWVDKWVDNSTSTSPSHYKNQQRGFYSLGGFKSRINTGTDSLFSIGLPRASGGCKGLNLMYGSFSMLDEDMIVKKLENMMAAAPAIAFDMALKALTKEFSESLKGFEQIVNQLNNIQLDDCAIAEGAVTAVVNYEETATAISDTWGKLTSEKEVDDSTAKNQHDAKEKQEESGGKIEKDLSDMYQGCHNDLKSFFATEGSVLERASSKFGMGDYLGIARGYIGDIFVTMQAPSNIPLYQPILPCDGNVNSNLDSFVEGYAEAREISLTPDAQCTVYRASGLKTVAETNMRTIAEAIKNKSALSQDIKDWINVVPLPVLSIMNIAVLENTVDTRIAITSELLAYAQSYHVFDELTRNIGGLINKLMRLYKGQGQTSDFTKECNKELFSGALPELKTMEKRLLKINGEMKQGYMKRLTEYEQLSNFIKKLQQENKESKSKETKETLGK